MTATLGTALVESGVLHMDRYGIPHVDNIALVDAPVLASGSFQALTLGSLSLTGVIVIGGAFGGQTMTSWVGGVGAWDLTLPSRPYHDDAGIMLSTVLGDLERDAAIAAGRSSLGTKLETSDVRLDVAGSWIRPAALGRDLLDALATAAGQPRGAWWIANDGSTHLGPRPSSSVSLPDLTVDPYDPALLRGVVRVADDDIASLLPGATLTANGLPAPLVIAATIVHVAGDDISVELWGEASESELFARAVQHVMEARVAYLGAQPYQVSGSAATDGRVPVAAPTGASFPDAPLLGHAPGIPGASFTLATGARVVVVCLGGSPGNPVCVAYPAGVLPLILDLSATTEIALAAAAVKLNGNVQLGGNGATPAAKAVVQNANNALISAALAAAGHPVTLADVSASNVTVL